MATSGTYVREVTLKGSAEKHYKKWRNENHTFPDAVGHHVQGITIHEGEWDSHGAIKTWNYTCGNSYARINGGSRQLRFTDRTKLQKLAQSINVIPMEVFRSHIDDKLMLLANTNTDFSVTTTEKPQTALELLRDNKNKFNLVISDVDMPDMDSFKLLDLLGLEMDLPVIMLSAHSHPKYLMEGVKHGASDYLLKSVRIEELKNIWQHVVRKIMFKKMKSILTNGESQGNSEQNGVKENRKRKDQLEEKEEEERGNENDDTTAQKKPHVIWSFGRERQYKFLAAVNHVGIESNVS